MGAWAEDRRGGCCILGRAVVDFRSPPCVLPPAHTHTSMRTPHSKAPLDRVTEPQPQTARPSWRRAWTRCSCCSRRWKRLPRAGTATPTPSSRPWAPPHSASGPCMRRPCAGSATAKRCAGRRTTPSPGPRSVWVGAWARGMEVGARESEQRVGNGAARLSRPVGGMPARVPQTMAASVPVR